MSGKYLRFTQDGAGTITVHAGTKRVGTIEMHGKYIRADVRYLDAMNAYVAASMG